MTMTLISLPEAEGGGEYRADLAVAFGFLAAFYGTDETAPLVTPHLTIPVPPGPRGQRVAALQDIADRLGVRLATRNVPDWKGRLVPMLVAERWFGVVRVEAFLPADEKPPVTDEPALRAAAEAMVPAASPFPAARDAA